MVLEIQKNRGPFKTKQVWFADYPYDVKGFDRVIFRDCKNEVDAPGFSCEKITTLTIDLKKYLDLIWQNMDKSSCRYAINRAKRDGVVIKTNENYESFFLINSSFRKKKKLSGESLSLEFIKKNGVLFTAEVSGETVGGNFFVLDNNNIRWVSGASKRLEDNARATLIGNANRLIIWEAIKYAKAKGIKEFDFGGYYTGAKKDEQKERINVFKKSFGGQLATHYIYQKEYSKIYTFFSYLINFLK